MKASNSKIIITCEHGGNKVPSEYRNLFHNKKPILNSHRGWDAGALILAKELAGKLDALLIISETSRLLVDLNRSLHHRNLFSEFTKEMDRESRNKILQNYYFPYRNHVEKEIRSALKNRKSVIHLSIHSFTPRLVNDIRHADIGLLHDPARKVERDFCMALQSVLRNQSGKLIVRRNYPYRGNADGFTTYLRKKFPRSKYSGIEVEINQKHIIDTEHWKNLRKHIITSIIRSIN